MDNGENEVGCSVKDFDCSTQLLTSIFTASKTGGKNNKAWKSEHENAINLF